MSKRLSSVLVTAVLLLLLIPAGARLAHGKDVVERKYKMPSNDIHPLPNTKEGFEAALKTEPTWPKWTKFMAEKVEPAMGKLLAVPVFNPQKPVEGAFS